MRRSKQSKRRRQKPRVEPTRSKVRLRYPPRRSTRNRPRISLTNINSKGDYEWQARTQQRLAFIEIASALKTQLTHSAQRTSAVPTFRCCFQRTRAPRILLTRSTPKHRRELQRGPHPGRSSEAV